MVTELAMGVPGAVTAVMDETSFCALVGTGMFTFTTLREGGTDTFTETGTFFASPCGAGAMLA